MDIKVDFTNMMADVIGEEHGIRDREIKDVNELASKSISELQEERKEGKLPFMDLPYQNDLVDEIEKTADEITERFENFVVLGIGGSALGNIALHNALNHPYYNLLDKEARNGHPKIFVMDNVDPDKFSGFLDIVDPKTTMFNVITKSGTTVETMSQFLIMSKMLKGRIGKNYCDNFICTTDKSQGLLREIADSEGFRSFIIPDGVGGRYSVLTPVGLLSASVSGININELLSGASSMDERCQFDYINDNPALMNALLQYVSYKKKGLNILIMMAYSNALSGIVDWFCQLWSESLGKEGSISGEIVNCGSTPVKAIGVTDQHSQLQLYMEGPFDKTITFLHVKKFDKNIAIPKGTIDKLEYLGGRTLNDLMEAEMIGTQLALTENKRPNCTITLPEVSESTIGQLLYMFEVQTALVGKMYGINPFDQPGVEAGKINAHAILGRKGFEERRKEIESYQKTGSKHIV
ncbi:MAG: glucose-6-phosphate isomerase [Candidatus Scalinduaceae bacterium]